MKDLSPGAAVLVARDGKILLNKGYGYGWMVAKLRGLQEISHGGGLQGFVSFLLRFPSERFTAVVLANAAAPPPGLDPTARARDIAEISLWEHMSARPVQQANSAVPSKAFEALVGRYDYGGAVLTVTQEGARLQQFSFWQRARFVAVRRTLLSAHFR
ncbi:MAG: serine hydrolase, partial [Verrucomicrobia bacterium]|nr:serine hydrolase [Verrucomicrobiota bacterium]